jgi:glycosyltransferase involved in cell wall biosynthesis
VLIGIDASRATVARRTGTEAYSLHLIRHLVELGGRHRFRLYTRGDVPDGLLPQGPNVERRAIWTRRLWTHIGLAGEVRRNPPDVLFVPAHVIPWRCAVPSVVTVHDLGYLYHPQAHPLLERLYLDWSTRHSVGLARAVIADSQATRDDLLRHYRLAADKIGVCYPGVDESLAPVRDPARLEAVHRKYSLSEDYILFVGTLRARKNLIRLVEAYGRLVARLDSPPALALVGKSGWGYDELAARIEGLGLTGRVILPGYVDEDDLAALYSGARAFAFPSLYEGFGFPILEAMRCGTPVVCSDAASLPELAGDAALIVPPHDIEALADALERILTDEALRADLIEKGQAQAARFTWEACAACVLRALERAADG